MFEHQPTLSGQCLALRPLQRGDRDSLYAAAADPLLWEQHPEPLRWQPEVFDRLFGRLIESGGALLVSDAITGQVAGSSSYYDHRADSADIVIGYTFLARPYWGGRYNAELKLLMLRHAFRFVETVWFHVGQKNLRSQKAMEKIGARLSHEMLRESGGVTATFLHYCILRSDFPRIAARLTNMMLPSPTHS